MTAADWTTLIVAQVVLVVALSAVAYQRPTLPTTSLASLGILVGLWAAVRVQEARTSHKEAMTTIEQRRERRMMTRPRLMTRTEDEDNEHEHPTNYSETISQIGYIPVGREGDRLYDHVKAKARHLT